jgi:polar amino acid transport system substrate-binding protein
MLWRQVMVGILCLVASDAVADQANMTVLFHVRPPYAYYDAAQDVTGLLATPVSAALSKAGVTAQWIEMPPARQTEEIKRAAAPMCALGWFRRPEREQFAQFTRSIYHDRATVVVARRDDVRFPNGMLLQDSFRDPARTLVVKTGYSYGAAIDKWITELQPHSEVLSGANEMLLGMIAQDRGDYAIMAPEEADYLLDSNPQLNETLHAIHLGDAPAGERRYLMCSKATPADLIKRINKALPH